VIEIYSGEPFPTNVKKTIFLAGPTPREEHVASWRPEALRFFREKGFDGHVIIPEWREKKLWSLDWQAQVDWEEEMLCRSDVILFWVPREMEHMPALTTNIEWGTWHRSGKCVLGAPPDAEHVRYMFDAAFKNSIPNSTDLEDLVEKAIQMCGEGAERVGGWTWVPLGVWQHPSFQRWRRVQDKAGNRLEWGRTLMTFPKGRKPPLLVFHAHVFIAEENRSKKNEVVVCRSDISAVVPWYRSPDGLLQNQYVLVKEFRTASTAEDAMVWEFPGGSSNDTTSPREVALQEIEEEVGFKADPERLKAFGSRQLASTMLAHHAHVFGYELTRAELDQILMVEGQVRGVAADGERTYVYVTTLEQILRRGRLDWSNLGMLLLASAEA
jgi:8-oxo-dGTP pyrophosphatase MutT (NUDIX family)